MKAEAIAFVVANRNVVTLVTLTLALHLLFSPATIPLVEVNIKKDLSLRMSRNKNSAGTILEIYDSIMERLSIIKPLLDGPKQSNGPSLTRDLNHVAHLAETFTERRPKTNKTAWHHLADSLDQEGVNLWNISGLIGKCPENNGYEYAAALRLAAFRLVEAGIEPKPKIVLFMCYS